MKRTIVSCKRRKKEIKYVCADKYLCTILLGRSLLPTDVHTIVRYHCLNGAASTCTMALFTRV
jgi:hypothetical protein